MLKKGDLVVATRKVLVRQSLITPGVVGILLSVDIERMTWGFADYCVYFPAAKARCWVAPDEIIALYDRNNNA